MNAIKNFRTLFTSKLPIIALSALTLFSACSKDDDKQEQNNETGVTIKLNGKEYHYEAEASVASNGEVTMEFVKTNPLPIEFYGGLAWKGGVGTYVWNDNTDFWWEPEGLNPKRVYQHLYDDGTEYSAGNITVTSLENAGGFITGRFVIEKSGATNTESGNAEYLGESKVEGSFKVERVD